MTDNGMIGLAFQRLRASTTGFSAAYWTLWVGAVQNRLGTFVLPFLAIYLTQSRHLGPVTIGLLTSLPGLGGIVAGGAMAVAGDRYDRRWVLAATAVAGAGAILGIAFVRPLLWLGLTVMVWSVCTEIQRPLLAAMMADVVPMGERRRAVALLRTGYNAAHSIGRAIGGLIASVAFLPLFIADAATTVAYGLICLRLPAPVRPVTSEAATTSGGRAAARVVTALRDRELLMLCAIYAGGGFVFSQLPTTFAIYATQIGGSVEFFAFLLALNAGLMLIFELPVIVALQPLPTNRMVPLSCLLFSLTMAATAVVRSPALLVLPVVIMSFAAMTFYPSVGEAGADVAPAELRGTYAGMLWTAEGIGFFLGPALGGLLLATAPALDWIASSGVALAAAVLGLGLGRRSPNPSASVA